MIDPIVFCCRAGFNGRDAMVLKVGDAVGNPIYMLLDRKRHVTQDGGAAGARDGEEVGEAGHHQAEVAARTSGPFVLQTFSISAADFDVVQSARHGFEASCEHNAIDRELLISGPHANGRDLDNRRAAQIYKRYVVAIVCNAGDTGYEVSLVCGLRICGLGARKQNAPLYDRLQFDSHADSQQEYFSVTAVSVVDIEVAHVAEKS